MSRFTLRTLLKSAPEPELRTLCGRWNGGTEPTEARAAVLRALAACMEDAARVQQRLEELPQKLADLLESFLREPGRAHRVPAILDGHAQTFKSTYELQASLAALQREGFVFPASNGTSFRDASYAVPDELATCIEEIRRRRRNELRGAVTLLGYLEQRYFGPRQRRDDPERAADHARKIYKLYLMESSIDGRVAKLPAPVRAVFDRSVAGFGGMMPAEEYDRFVADNELDVDLDLVRKCLEENMLGTVGPLRLARFGIEPVERAVVVFHEIVLARLQKLSECSPCAVEEAQTGGVDLVTNVGRFLREVAGSCVQFTVEGRLYRASARRIVKGFLPVPGGFMPPDTQIRFIYRFCLARRLIERSGERALRLSESGHAFEQRTLIEKLKDLLAFAVEERAPQGEHFHQVRLRRILLRLLRRIEPEQWHEALFIPFLARNAYLAKVEEFGVESFFAARFKGGGYVPTENVLQVCRHLLDFVKRRLFPLGVVELGMHDKRPVALRLSRLGAELLGSEVAAEVGGSRSSVVVNPDFEIILFPGDDEHEVVHSFDRFCHRIKTDHIHHFRLSKASVHEALADGMTLSHIVQDLTDRSRAPVPQNVLYSLEDWADQAGLLTLGPDRILTGRRAEPIDRFLALSQFGRYVSGRRSPTSIALRPEADVEALCDVARELGFFIEHREDDAGA